MPTYDYECDACGHEFELFQPITENPKKKCPQCKKSKLRRLFGTGAAIVFKGSGFYQTDYRSESYKKAAEKDSKSSDTSKSSEGSSEKSKKKDASAATAATKPKKSDGE
jgi:putative FmdB family regulatory protein